MQAIIETLQAIGVFLGGLVGRFGIFLFMLAVLVVPALLIAAAAHAVERRHRKALGLRSVAGVLFRPGARYAPGHTWLAARPSGSFAVGVDDIAQRLLPAITLVELARPGDEVKKGETIAQLHGGGRVVRIAAPMSGTIAGVNAAVIRDPTLVKRDGYGKGWLVALAARDESWMALPGGADAERWMCEESKRFARAVEARLGMAAADGGELIAPAPWLLGEEGWRNLAAEFLGS